MNTKKKKKKWEELVHLILVQKMIILIIITMVDVTEYRIHTHTHTHDRICVQLMSTTLSLSKYLTLVMLDAIKKLTIITDHTHHTIPYPYPVVIQQVCEPWFYSIWLFALSFCVIQWIWVQFQSWNEKCDLYCNAICFLTIIIIITGRRTVSNHSLGDG